MHRLFDDKPRDYTAPSLNAEWTYAGLDRSSLPEYKRVRPVLERSVDRYPSEHQSKIVGKSATKVPDQEQMTKTSTQHSLSCSCTNS